jgi:hypothetical protein
VSLTSRGRVKAVIIGVEAFETLLGAQSTAGNQPMPVAKLRRELRQSLAQAGYETRDDLVALVQEVKRELVEEDPAISVETRA